MCTGLSHPQKTSVWSWEILVLEETNPNRDLPHYFEMLHRESFQYFPWEITIRVFHFPSFPFFLPFYILSFSFPFPFSFSPLENAKHHLGGFPSNVQAGFHQLCAWKHPCLKHIVSWHSMILWWNWQLFFLNLQPINDSVMLSFELCMREMLWCAIQTWLHSKSEALVLRQ